MAGEHIFAGDEIATAIATSGLSIYDPVDRQSGLFFDISVLESRLQAKLRGLNLSYPLRTRAKHSKAAVCVAMGYPVPRSFRKTQPRFPGQDVDVYVQKADNLQIWNEEIAPTRRYVLIRLNAHNRVVDVRIVTGESLAQLDKTGTLTHKFQASRRAGAAGSKLVSAADTDSFTQLYGPSEEVPPHVLAGLSPVARPAHGSVLSVQTLYQQLLPLIGQTIADVGVDQERNRGAALQRVVCQMLGLGAYADQGQFPDIVCQALEVKLQTSPTIDLGLVSPDSQEPAEQVGASIQHRDVRYLVVYAARHSASELLVTAIVVATGRDFFNEFQRFEGRIRNQKLQIPLPPGFFREPE